MKQETIIGAVLAVIFLGVLAYLGLSPNTHGLAGAASVDAGFVGVQQYGPWQLACGKPQPGETPAAKTSAGGIPLSLSGGSPSLTAEQASRKLGRCRATLIYLKKDNPKQLILVVSFRYTVAGDKLAVIVRFPQIAQKGDTILLQVTDKAGLKLPVVQCGTEGCFAAGLLGGDAQTLIVNGQRAVMVFPTKKDAKPLIMPIPLTGLKGALQGMLKAES
ncbi:MAG TPA: invasion associated locus B family protein [Rhizomicrobium sp.]|jgi:invasion protein IalB